MRLFNGDRIRHELKTFPIHVSVKRIGFRLKASAVGHVDVEKAISIEIDPSGGLAVLKVLGKRRPGDVGEFTGTVVSIEPVLSG